ARAQLAREQVAQLARADKADALVLRHARVERPALVVHDAMRLPNLREADAGRRMRVHDSAHIGSGGVDARVDPELAVRRPSARENLAFAVEDQQRARAGEAGAAPRGHEEGVGARDAGTRVPEGVRQAEALDDEVGERHVALERAFGAATALRATHASPRSARRAG